MEGLWKTGFLPIDPTVESIVPRPDKNTQGWYLLVVEQTLIFQEGEETSHLIISVVLIKLCATRAYCTSSPSARRNR